METIHEQFKAAKEIALTINRGEMRRARYADAATVYCGANIGGRMFVIADSEKYLQNPDCEINGKPAREVFGDFTVMYK